MYFKSIVRPSNLDDALPNSGKSQISKKNIQQNLKDLSNPQIFV